MTSLATPPVTSAKSLLRFLEAARLRLSSPIFMTELGQHLSQHSYADRGAIFEQVVAYEYQRLWPLEGTNNEQSVGEGTSATAVAAVSESLQLNTLLDASDWAKESKRANLEADREPDARNDSTLHKVLILLNYYVNEQPDTDASPRILRGWQQLELAEERAVLRSNLPDERFADLLQRDKDCDSYGEQCYNKLNVELSNLPPQQRLEKTKAIQDAGMKRLMEKAPNFQKLGPGERQKVIQDMTAEERKPIIEMNVLNVVVGHMQKMQKMGESMIQQYLQVLPTMDQKQIAIQLEQLRVKAFEVLPDNFVKLSMEDRQIAAMSVPYEKKIPVVKWNAMCAALQIVAHQTSAASTAKPDKCCKSGG
jgi:hypothetical protein